MILWKNSYVEDDNGNIINILSSGLDITENLQIRNKLKESEELLRKVFDVSDEIIFIKDLDGTYINANKAFSEILIDHLMKLLEKKMMKYLQKKKQNI